MKRETLKKIVKVSIGTVAGVTAGVVITAAIKGIVPMEELSKMTKIMYKVGIFAIAGVVTNYAEKSAGELVDTTYYIFDVTEKLVNQPA